MVVNCSLLFMMAMLFRASTVIISPDLMGDLHLSIENLGLLGLFFFMPLRLRNYPWDCCWINSDHGGC